MKTNTENIIQNIADECDGCGTCTEVCEHLQSQGDNYPDRIAEALLGGNPSDEIKDFILKCSLCGLCHESCPQGLDVPKMIRETRTDFFASGVSDPEQYRFFWVDHDWNVFTLFSQAHKLDEVYNDLLKERCEVLFFPGCMLANAGPSLVRAAASWLADRGEDVGLSVNCCGAPLEKIGLKQRTEAYTARLWRTVEAAGTRQVVTACPGCHARLLETSRGSGIEVVSIFKCMAESGLKAPVAGNGKITVHDSCPDRHGEIGEYVRKLLGNYEIKEMMHSGTNTICCGSGGFVSAIDPDICEERAEKRLKELADTGSQMCVTSCVSCAYWLASQSGQHEIRHILELVLNQRIDYQEFDEKANAMWQGDEGEEYFDLLQQSKLQEF